MCIAAGCDYLKSIKGIGIKRAFQIVISEHNLMELLSLRGASDEYKERFYKVEAVFKHQTVFLTWKSVSLFLCRRAKPSFLQVFNVSVESRYNCKCAKSTVCCILYFGHSKKCHALLPSCYIPLSAVV